MKKLDMNGEKLNLGDKVIMRKDEDEIIGTINALTDEKVIIIHEDDDSSESQARCKDVRKVPSRVKTG